MKNNKAIALTEKLNKINKAIENGINLSNIYNIDFQLVRDAIIERSLYDDIDELFTNITMLVIEFKMERRSENLIMVKNHNKIFVD